MKRLRFFLLLVVGDQSSENEQYKQDSICRYALNEAAAHLKIDNCVSLYMRIDNECERTVRLIVSNNSFKH